MIGTSAVSLALAPVLPQASDSTPQLLSSAEHSRFVQRIRRRHADALVALPPGLPRRPAIQALVTQLQRTRELPLGAALRLARQVVLERLVVLDVEDGADAGDVMQSMTELAEVALDLALADAEATLAVRHGRLVDEAGDRIDFWIVGMGKLGARELNVSSDIDLVYVYERDGATDGELRISADEYCSLLARQLHTLIGETTDDGFVFRVDLALRPNGNSGPIAVSLPALDAYLQTHGREWERFAWLKSRVVAPRASVENGRARALRASVTAFVYRRYLDYGVFESLRQLHAKVREEAQRRAAGRPQRANDVKLSRGGIREIEFIVQLQLVVRGGQFPEIRTRSTTKALQRLAAGGLMKPSSADRLTEAYTFLRRVEHRIQYLDDQQTHLLPTNDADLDWIARSLGLAGDAGVAELLDLLGAAREVVATEFDALLSEGKTAATPQPGSCSKTVCRTCGPAPQPVDSDSFIGGLPEGLAERVRTWCAHPKIQALRNDSKLRLARLVTRTAAAVTAGRCTMEGAHRFIDWIEPLLRRESYLALLLERPEVQNRLLRLLGLARWPAQYLQRHPGVVDELADEGLLHGRFDAEGYTADLEARHAAWERSGQASEELLLDTLRRAYQAEVFRTLVRDVEGHITVEQVADDLSALADATVDCAMRWAWLHLKQRHLDEPRLAVIAYGKLGSKELGYGSDLDIVFLYDTADGGDADRDAEVYSAYARKLINWLTLRTAAGGLFDIDTALRPNGGSGLLVTSLAAFDRYQTGRGGNTAWTWEHQALTRARFCAGWSGLAAGFDAVRRAVLCAPRDVAALRAEVLSMRDKLRAAHKVDAGLFDVKHSPGGMIDAEFTVQYLVLAHGAAQPLLMDDVGNIALLLRAESLGLLPAGIGADAADAYRALRSLQHRARLDERPTQVDAAGVEMPRDSVLRLWRAVFDDKG